MNSLSLFFQEAIFESFVYLLKVILADIEPKQQTLPRISERQSAWQDLYHNLAKNHFQGAKNVAMDIFGQVSDNNTKLSHNLINIMIT